MKPTMLLDYLKPKGMFYYTIKCQIEGNVSHRYAWLRTFVNCYHVPLSLRYIFAIFCIFTDKQSLLEYDIGFKMIIQIIFGDNYVFVCFFLLNFFTINLTRMLSKINQSPNGQFMHELVVLNMEDFTINNPTIRSFQTWPFQIFWKQKSLNFTVLSKIHFSKNFQHFTLMSHKSRIVLLMFVSVCEIFSGVCKSIFGMKI